MNLNHGTYNQYVNHHCRCRPCTDASTTYQMERRARQSNQSKDPADPRHGTYSFYKNHGCRCLKCRAGNSAYKRLCKAKNRLTDKQKAFLDELTHQDAVWLVKNLDTTLDYSTIKNGRQMTFRGQPTLRYVRDYLEGTHASA